MGSFLSPLVREPRAALALRNRRTGVVIARQLEAAFDSRARNRGLLGRTGLAPEQALVIAPCNAVHTFFMTFAIDVLFVARDGTVRRISSGLRPWRIAASPTSYAVIETAAGVAAQTDVRCGDAVVIEPA